MPPPIRPRLPVHGSDFQLLITDDGSRTLIHPASDDSYHSGCGALQETRHVYLGNSLVASRLENGHPTAVLEVGVGTAMAMLLCIESSLKSDAEFTYDGLEREWVTSDVMQALNPWDWLDNREVVSRYLSWREQFPLKVPEGIYEWQYDKRRCCRIHVGNALDWRPSATRFDAIFFDPFAPASNPELWQLPMLERMRSTIADHGRLVTYCVNREVRDTFAKAGFDVIRVSGPPGGKREVMVAVPSAVSSHANTPPSPAQ